MPGAIVYKPGSTVENKTGSWRSFRPVVDQNKCTKCRQCETYCPDIAIVVKENAGADVDYDYCKGCGICASVCPVKAITMREEAKQERGFTCARSEAGKEKVECSE